MWITLCHSIWCTKPHWQANWPGGPCSKNSTSISTITKGITIVAEYLSSIEPEDKREQTHAEHELDQPVKHEPVKHWTQEEEPPQTVEDEQQQVESQHDGMKDIQHNILDILEES